MAKEDNRSAWNVRSRRTSQAHRLGRCYLRWAAQRLQLRTATDNGYCWPLGLVGVDDKQS